MSDKYKELLDAVHALDPFSADFNTANSINSKKPECNYHCKICGADVINVKHDNDCPVVKIRNILTEAEEKKCSEDQGYKLVYAPHRDELDKAIQIIERHRLSKLNAKAVIDYSGALESAIVDEVLYIKNASDKDVVIPLDKPFIKSPTDNGV